MSNERDILVERSLNEIIRLSNDTYSNAKVVKINEFKGEYGDYPHQLSKRVVNIYKKKGIDKLYSHQAAAVNKVLNNQNVIVATPTASGKTLIYNSVALDALEKNSSAKSLYLFPTKALSQDQLSELFELNSLLGNKLGLYTYDGDTAQSQRKAIRKKAQIVITNPYMLHAGILPHHTKWINLFENLKYIVIDELHYYTGVFGSHMGNIIRRLKRICRFYGSNPVFIMSSATISNPQGLAEKIIEQKVELIEKNGAPRGEKYIVFYNPPVVNPELGIRRSYVSVARAITGILLKNGLQVITFTNSRLRTEVLVKYLKNDFEKKITDRDKIRGYRGGYLPHKRREIESGLREGKISGVVSTNALELGIDIGSLDACVLASYPGTIASTWQRLGRAGRRSNKSMGVVIASSSPINQFIVNHPEYFTGKSPETGRIDPDNLIILMDHIKCAAFELPFKKGENFGKEDLPEILKHLSENNVLLEKEDKWFWTEEGYPADAVSITRVTSDNFVVVDKTEGDKVIAEVDFSSALDTLHEKAIYILEGEQYVVEKFDYDNRKAFVRKSDSDYYTDAVSNTKISVLDIFDEEKRDRYNYSTGDVHVFTQVVGFKKLKFFSNENVGAGNLQLPQQDMHTTAFWVTIKLQILESIEISAEKKLEAISGISHLLRHICAVLLMCDIRDIGVTLEDNTTGTSINTSAFRKMPNADYGGINKEFEPNIYIYDNYPGGIGFSETLFERAEELLEKTLDAIKVCDCTRGCPSCVGPPISATSNHKEVAEYILKVLVSRIYN